MWKQTNKQTKNKKQQQQQQQQQKKSGELMGAWVWHWQLLKTHPIILILLL